MLLEALLEAPLWLQHAILTIQLVADVYVVWEVFG